MSHPPLRSREQLLYGDQIQIFTGAFGRGPRLEHVFLIVEEPTRTVRQYKIILDMRKERRPHQCLCSGWPTKVEHFLCDTLTVIVRSFVRQSHSAVRSASLLLYTHPLRLQLLRLNAVSHKLDDNAPRQSSLRTHRHSGPTVVEYVRKQATFDRCL